MLPRPLLLIVIFLFITLALCSPVPQGTVWVTATSTVRGPTATSIPDVNSTCNHVTGTEETFVGMKFRFRTEPTGRGTIGILVSCAATYIFCVWTTVAPAVGETGKTKLRLWYKLILTFVAIIVPAGVMIYALDEHRQASNLVDAWEKYLKPDQKNNKSDKTDPKLPQEESPQSGHGQKSTGGTTVSVQSHSERYIPLDIGTAFFVLMGGFRVENKAGDYKENPKKKPSNPKPRGGEEVYDRPILTAHGFVEYIKTNRITPSTFNQAEILDKGKGNNIAKIFAAIQGVWLILQSCARWVADMPLTVLEIHVLIQILCTILIFWCWFRKPLDVGVPTTIQLKEFPNERPLNKAQEQALAQVGNNAATKAPTQAHTEAQSPPPVSPHGFGTPEQYSPAAGSRAYTYAGETPHSRATSPFPMRSDTRASHMTGNSTLISDTITISSDFEPNSPTGDTNKPVRDIHEPAVDCAIKRHHFANRDSLYHEATKQPLKTGEQVKANWLAVSAKAFLDVVAHVRPIYNDDRRIVVGDKSQQEQERGGASKSRFEYNETTFTAWMVIVQGFLVVLVASLHLGAWFTEFPTRTEQLLWRASCFGMIGVPVWVVAVICFNDYDQDMFDILWRTHLQEKLTPVMIIPFALKQIHYAIRKHSLTKKDQEEYRHKKEPVPKTAARTPKMIQHYIMFWSCMIALAIYFIASLFITVESFISMRYLTDANFQSPRWSNFIPHL